MATRWLSLLCLVRRKVPANRLSFRFPGAASYIIHVLGWCHLSRAVGDTVRINFSLHPADRREENARAIGDFTLSHESSSKFIMKPHAHVRTACLSLLPLILVTTIIAPDSSSAPARQDRAAATMTPGSATEFETKPITEWVGEQFVFLGRDPSLRKYGYQLIYPAGQMIGTLPYDGYVGKVVRVTAVTPSSARVRGSYNVEMAVVETGERLRALASGGNVSGAAMTADTHFNLSA